MADIELIQKAMEDVKENMATKSEVTDLIKKEMKQDEQKAKALEAEAEKQKGLVTELKEKTISLESQIKQLKATKFASIKTPDGLYNGFWGSLDTAKAFGMFVLSSLKGIKSETQEAAKSFLENYNLDLKYMVGDSIVQKAMTGINNADGGALIPQEFMGLLPSMMGLYGVFRRNAQEWPMAGDSAYGVVQTGDVTVYGPGAGTAPTASSPGFKNIGLNAKKFMTLTAIDRELDEDSAIAVGEIVGRSIARAFAKKEDQIGFNGDGTSTYFGFTGIIPALLAVDATPGNIQGLHVQATAGAWSKITRDDILALPGKIADEADDGIDCKWYCNKNFFYTVMVARALDAGGTAAHEILATAYKRQPLFEGRPVEFTSVMHKVKYSDDHIPLMLANMRLAALLGDRRRLTIDTSEQALFTSDQIAIRGTERVAINCSSNVGSTTEVGAVVGLLADIS